MADVRDVTWQFINRAPIAASQRALDDLFAQTLAFFGFQRFDCFRLASNGEGEPEGILSGRGLDQWNDYFSLQGYAAIDPCIQAYPSLTGAYTWSQVKALGTHSASPMWGDAQANGMREGLLVPTAPRRPTAAIVRLVTSEADINPEVLPLLQSISVIYASSTNIFLTKSSTLLSNPRKVPLTEREVECLHWAARGKTNAEIGLIANISRHTVNTHIENAKAKLGVATRMQAAILAHKLGLMSIA
jgi:LuxR family quorum sensing-dependent transcriptional regulator